ncbi:MAG TPA: GNAT family N-acetyltransferase [Jatrophihabitans sp.]|jgi:aminoglycoside 2'-N-acetyltransferase I|uniref:GNAT family N-acetyltransferase n=1 Tax=Jatrophihabitans sp. TaxID=1932789 RepID=UPI002EF3C929
MTKLVLAHTGQLDPADLTAAHQLLQEVFAGELTEQDWEHCLGGVHALLWEDAELVGHAALIQRRLLHNGRALRTGYLEGVGVRGAQRRRGHGAAMMAALERVARGAYELGALGSTEEAAPFYARRGWRPWQGPTSALTPTGVVRTEEEDGWIYVLPMSAALDLRGELTCDWRDGDAW